MTTIRMIALTGFAIEIARERDHDSRDVFLHDLETTTERYDNQKLENLRTAVLKRHRGKTFDPTDTNCTENAVMSGTKFQVFFKIRLSPEDR